MVPIAPLANLSVLDTWVGVSTSIFVPYFGSLVIRRSGNVMRASPETLVTGPIKLTRAVR